MSDISKIKLPNGDIYNLKDNQALHQGDATLGAITGIVKQNSSLLTITNGAKNYPIEELKITFGPHQQGSGDPSPENVRPISGWDGVSVFVSATSSGGTEYPIAWQEAGTVYGGIVDVINGLLTLTHKSTTINETTQFDFRDSGRYVVFEQPDMLSGSHYADANTLCDKVVKVSNVADAPSDVLAVLIGSNNKRLYFYHFDTALNITTASAFTEWIAQNPIAYTYPLATPIIYQLTPQQINTLLGENNIWTNIDGIISIKYAADTKLFIQQNTVKDVQINNTSITNNRVANIPIANSNTLGTIKTNYTYGLTVNNDGTLVTYGVGESGIKNGNNWYQPIMSARQDQSVFYGLAKAAGADMKDSANAIGTYTDTAKTAICDMIGASDIVKVQDTQPTTPTTQLWIQDSAQAAVQVPTVSEMEQAIEDASIDVQINGTSITNNGVANIPLASINNSGVVKIDPTYGISSNSNVLRTLGANDVLIQEGINPYRSITPATQHIATFYGLAKAAGDTTQTQSNNAVGTYTSEAKTAIQQMIGLGTINASTVAATLDSTSKTYLLGTQSTITSTAANVSVSGDTGVYLTTNQGQISATQHSINVNGTEKAYMTYNTTDQSIDFIFI